MLVKMTNKSFFSSADPYVQELLIDVYASLEALYKEKGDVQTSTVYRDIWNSFDHPYVNYLKSEIQPVP
ncbi:MAG: hypothetical protein A2Z88_10580 [Omnitrophica WOR_2 bacterium GWA2_47_8]|nr:MAG: hypothetical protein A2Z88_10580 [Omnitrophica WOR_2 bacterium GWA2_47_8]